MGSRSSKGTVGAVRSSPSSSSSSSSSSSRRGRSWPRSFGRKFLGSACLGLPQLLSDENNQEQNDRLKENALNLCKQDQGNQHLKFAQTGALSSNNISADEGNQENAPHLNSDFSSSSAIRDTPTTNSPTYSRSHSRFGFLPDGINFRLGRASTLGSANADAVFSRSFTIPRAGEDHRTDGLNDSSLENGSRSCQDGIFDATSSHDSGTHNLRSNMVARNARRRLQESIEGTARFSRTLSVGRLRDRVLQRTSLQEGRFDSTISEEGSSSFSHGSARRNLESTSDDRVAPERRESNTQDTLEYRSAILARRRRIRSQVHALQRLGSRFENLLGHESTCIQSAQHRTGRCACRTNNRSANSGDDTSTTASISRIVMLAEALFEVLDEIHQQAVVLASRPSISSIGSAPAPREVVDSMPAKIYAKTQKQQDDAAQCDICLVEYVDGDFIRVLPCHHEFHRSCVDKWLKEIHRVCPLCRGDVCVSNASPVDELD